jgi:hypothetical protein
VRWQEVRIFGALLLLFGFWDPVSFLSLSSPKYENSAGRAAQLARLVILDAVVSLW